MNGYYERVLEILKLHSFGYLKNSKGSHEVWSNGKINVTVPFNCPSRHTANAIMKQSGISYKF